VRLNHHNKTPYSEQNEYESSRLTQVLLFKCTSIVVFPWQERREKDEERNMRLSSEQSITPSL